MHARDRVRLFLHGMKMAAAVRFIFEGRTKNMQTLASLGITRPDAQSRVLGLTPEDYSSGPSPDHKHPGRDVWVFGLFINGTEIYVKVQVVSDPPEKCVCISFHEADRPLTYPLRKTDPTANEEDQR